MRNWNVSQNHGLLCQCWFRGWAFRWLITQLVEEASSKSICLFAATVAGRLRVTSLSHGALLSIYMCTSAANVNRKCYFVDGVKSIEHYWSWACERWILRFVLYLCVLCFTSVPPAIPGNQSPHPVWGLLRLKGRLAWYCTTQQSLVSEGAVNGLCMWSWKMNNNMKSVLSAGKAEAKEPEGCFYILDHQPFFLASKIMMNAI